MTLYVITQSGPLVKYHLKLVSIYICILNIIKIKEIIILIFK